VGHLGGAISEFLACRFQASDEARVFEALGACLALKVAERQEQFSAQLALPHALPTAEYAAALADYREQITGLLSARF
jgi:hypothetical protein